MKFEIKGLKNFKAGTRAAINTGKEKFERRISECIVKVHRSITDLTPVWSGEALVNYFWTRDVPYTGALRQPLGDQSDPGPTNSMPLGVEPNRAENQAVVDGELNALDIRKPLGHVFYFTNPHPKIRSLNEGLLPTKKLSRSKLFFEFTQRSLAQEYGK